MPSVVLWTVMPIALIVLAGVPPAQGQSVSATFPGDIDPESRARLPGVKRDDLDAEGKRTYDLVVNPTTPYRHGLPTPIGMWMHSPKMAQHILPGYLYLRFGGDSGDGMFDVRLTELAILVTARQVNSQYQWTSHEPTAPKVGLEQAIIDVVKFRRSLEGLGEKEALIIRFGRELFGDRRVSSETFAHALKVFGRPGVTDLAALMAFYEFLFLSSNATFDIQMQRDWQPLLPASREPSPSGTSPSSTAKPSEPALPKDIDPESRARLPEVKRDDLDAEGNKTYDAIVNPQTPYSRGLPSPIGMWMHSPRMAQHFLPAYMYLSFGNQLGQRLTELAILVTARQINSQYQWTSHEPTAPKVGLEQAIIDVVKYRRSVEGLGEKEALIIRFGRELFGDRRVSSETFAHALKVFGRPGVTDLAALMAFYEFLFLSSNATFDIQMPADWQPLLPKR